jgi:hypothetical protein
VIEEVQARRRAMEKCMMTECGANPAGEAGTWLNKKEKMSFAYKHVFN